MAPMHLPKSGGKDLIACFYFQNSRQHHIENQKKWYLLNQIVQRYIWSGISYKFWYKRSDRIIAIMFWKILTFKSNMAANAKLKTRKSDISWIKCAEKAIFFSIKFGITDLMERFLPCSETILTFESKMAAQKWPPTPYLNTQTLISLEPHLKSVIFH